MLFCDSRWERGGVSNKDRGATKREHETFIFSLILVVSFVKLSENLLNDRFGLPGSGASGHKRGNFDGRSPLFIRNQ
jgi:hypothetical protein